MRWAGHSRSENQVNHEAGVLEVGLPWFPMVSAGA